MITRVEIDGFKSFVEFELDLKPFTVLAGPNNSGKSNLLDAVTLVRDVFLDLDDRPLVNQLRGTGVELFHRADDGTPSESFDINAVVRLPQSLGDGPLRLVFGAVADHGRLEATHRWVSRAGERIRDLGDDTARLRLQLTSWVSVNPDAVAMRHGASLNDGHPLSGAGANLAAVIGRIFEQDGAAEFVLDAQFVIGDLSSVRPIRDERRNQWDFDVVMRGGRTFTPALVSDGTLRVLALLAALHDPDHRGVVMIEDLENGLHPEYQGKLCDRLAARTADTGRQVIATTHSPVVVSAALEQALSTVVFLDQVVGPVGTRDGMRRPRHRTRARRIANGGDRGTYVSAAELDKYLALQADGRRVARYLTATLFCEGREDGTFLGRVLSRRLAALGLEGPGFDVADVFTHRCRTVEESGRVQKSVLAAARDFDLVFVHHDWNERGKVDSLRKRVDQALPAETRLLGLVPVRETEAWPLADPAAFPKTGGHAVVLPARPKDVEAVLDPKQLLEKAIGRQYDERIAVWIGERIDLGSLAQVPAYADFLRDLMTALKELHFL